MIFIDGIGRLQKIEPDPRDRKGLNLKKTLSHCYAALPQLSTVSLIRFTLKGSQSDCPIHRNDMKMP
ncbi:hypothetical protein [Paraburkholderia azotifigens]|uniref:Uncharacterized protein n=1 Tax=Paraburkholderia azotifigens TaxID=2057004 RepID=A0A5C6V7K3_9BURK|nr:hypothetical protein [Paraburkholderia azotifigens]TXC81017.1 hypothetical protein FRZ40_43250 [Paraburkholderia azotifigens]